jgi:hypothetical protein
MPRTIETPKARRCKIHVSRTLAVMVSDMMVSDMMLSDMMLSDMMLSDIRHDVALLHTLTPANINAQQPRHYSHLLIPTHSATAASLTPADTNAQRNRGITHTC